MRPRSRDAQADQAKSGELPAPEPGPTAPGNLLDYGLSVAEALQTAPMNRGELVGGAAGLARRFGWVHVVDHSDVEDSLAGSELLLTSGVTLAAEKPLQREIFEIMKRVNSAGLVIAIGRYIERIPRTMIDASQASGIPLIAMPWEVNFGDITRELLTRLVQTHHRFLERTERLNRDLLALLARKGDLTAICERLAGDVDRPVAVADEAFRLLAHCRRDEARWMSDRALPSAAPAPARSGGRAAASPILLHGRQVGLAAPILTASRPRGWILLDASGEPLHRLDLLAAEIAANACALVISHNDDLVQASRRRADQLLMETLDGITPSSPALFDELGLEALVPTMLAVIGIDQGDAERAAATSPGHLARFFGTVLVVARNRMLVAVVQKQRDRRKDWASALADALREQGCRARIAVSRPLDHATLIAKAYAEAREALELGRLLRPNATVLKAEQALMLGRVMRDLRASADPRELCPTILRIEANDRSLSGSLIEALERFLDADGNVSLAARQLGIHRHTLLYRLNRIGELIGVELDTATRLELRLQLMAWRFMKA